MSENITDRLSREFYTTEEVAQAMGRTPGAWCRVRHQHIAEYNLHVIKLGKRIYYSKESVDKMLNKILTNGQCTTQKSVEVA